MASKASLGRIGMVLVAAVMLASASLPAGASGSQVQTGWLYAPSGPYRAGPVLVSECRGVADATVRWVTGRHLPFASRFAIDAATHGEPFTLTPHAPADLAIVFEIAGWTGRGFDERRLDGESGTVPENARAAYVCLAAGPPTAFTYRAGS